MNLKVPATIPANSRIIGWGWGQDGIDASDFLLLTIIPRASGKCLEKRNHTDIDSQADLRHHYSKLYFANLVIILISILLLG